MDKLVTGAGVSRFAQQVHRLESAGIPERCAPVERHLEKVQGAPEEEFCDILTSDHLRVKPTATL